MHGVYFTTDPIVHLKTDMLTPDQCKRFVNNAMVMQRRNWKVHLLSFNGCEQMMMRCNSL